MTNISKPNKIIKNLSYALMAGIYYNNDGFAESTDNKPFDYISEYNAEKYVYAKETKPNKHTYVNYKKPIMQLVKPIALAVLSKLKQSVIYNNFKNIETNIKQGNNLNNVNYIKEIKEKTKRLVYTNHHFTKNSYHCYYTPDNNILYLSGWVRFYRGKVVSHNYGDDINFSFLPCITGYEHQLYKPEFFRKQNFLMIGSVLIDRYIDQYTLVWGTGMLRNRILKNKPYKVHAVRGPKTREVLLKSGINCPEIYGDPALLMPYYYYPYIYKKKYKLGIIPHHSHIKHNNLQLFKNDLDIKIIDFTSYNHWKDIINEIMECEFIVSESLHGLIIAEAYKIPNIWISFSPIGQNFKYEDFFLSVGKLPYNAYKITNLTTKEDLLLLKNKYEDTFNIDLNKLVLSCPVLLKNLNIENRIKTYTGKVLLCCIAKMENNYIKEFVEYYKKLGFDNICLYDNNDIDGEKFEDVIKDYIDSGYVILKDWRGKEQAQIPSYTDCYNTYKDEYDWIAYFDIDEFLHIDNNKNIKQFLSNSMFNDRGINTIRICWKLFTDSGIIKTNGNYSINKYTDYLPLKNSVSGLSKIIIKTVLDNVKFSSPHGIWNNKYIITVNTAGELCNNSITIKNKTWDNACLYHYRFRTIEEFVLNKMVRLWPTHYLNGGKSGLNLKLFFTYNKETPEKIKYAEYLLNKYNISRNV